MEKHIWSAGTASIPEDQILEALRRFWHSLTLDTFRDAVRVCAGLALPLEQSGPSLMDDSKRFQAALDGLEPWRQSPCLFRRCFFGLMHSYFTCDPETEPHNTVKRENWRRLRDYLRGNSGRLLETGKINPDWAHCLQEHVRLFGPEPCAFYAQAILNGDESDAVLKPLREQLHITASSWFHRELVLGQVKAAVAEVDAGFRPLLGRLLRLLEDNTLLRSPGLTLLLERYARIPGQPLHSELRDAAVRWWQNPWLPSTAAQWGGMSHAAKDMVAGWLKREFIESFFQKLAQDGNNDSRRAKFWLRYVKSMGDVRFALGYNWEYSRDRDVRVLLEKMKGLYKSMDRADGSAFIMTLGDVVAVEFGKQDNRLYVYSRDKLPFDPGKHMATYVDVHNSLKNNANLFKFTHYGNWEPNLEGRLRQYGISPDDAATVRRRQPPVNTISVGRVGAATDAVAAGQSSGNTLPRPAVAGSYSFDKLRQLAKDYNFRIEDRTAQGGCVWAYTSHPEARRRLTSWGFRYKDSKGWWLKP
ncbi:MAG: EH signature domain-containing protein [Desulfobulbus sp.]|nr:EH signature domain-containing protein [Desulfobulbus sp.]